jgi:sialate O-acetylesterase
MPDFRKFALMSSLFPVFFLAAALTNAMAAAPADPPPFRFAKIFTDDMVLQQEKPIRVWGWAGPGARVAVTLTQDRAAFDEAMARVLGEEATKDNQPAASEDDGSYSLTVQYVEKNPPKLKTHILETKAGADGRWLVEFQPAKASFVPTWIMAATGDEAIALQNVLIGEIWVCAGQSNMGWSNFNRKGREAASADFPGLRYVAWHDSWYKPLDDVRSNIGWQVCSPESAQGFSAVPYLYGMFLHRYLKVPVGIINVARGGTLGQTWCTRDELDTINNDLMKTVLKEYDAETAVWDDPQQVERIMADWEKECEQKKADHETQVAQAKAEGKKEPRLRLPKKPGDPRSGWSPPAGLFNATVMPIRDLGIRGVLYYQGENNNFLRWTRYESTFPKVPVSFRKAFGDEKLPFGCISQPGWGTFGMDPELATVAEGYAIVRDIQRRALQDDPHAAMIATYPTGNSYIHPGEKFPVAEYASLWALAKVYGAPIVHRANQYQEMKKQGDRIYLFFDSDPVVYERWKHIEDNAYWQVLPCPREGNAELRGFIISGNDRRWYPAKAKHTKLDGKCSVEVWSDLVDDPVAVRYGWANWPTGNMVGRERLPLPTFRTDNWPLPEGAGYSEEAQQRSRENIDRLKQAGEQHALDRKIRQMEFDLPNLETELYLRKLGSKKQLIESKLRRIDRALAELEETDEWLARQIQGSHAELAERLKAARLSIDALKAEAAKIEEEK